MRLGRIVDQVKSRALARQGNAMPSGRADVPAPTVATRQAKRRLAGSAEAKGHLERIDDGGLEGWIAAADNSPIGQCVTLWCDGEAVATIDTLGFRADLKAAGIAEGQAAFRVDVARLRSSGLSQARIGLSVGPDDQPRHFLDQVVPLKSHVPLNANHTMRPGGPADVPGWRIDHDPAIGLRIDDFPAPHSLKGISDRYTRLAFTDGLNAQRALVLSCPVRLDRELAQDIMVGLVLRADRPTAISCQLFADGELVGDLHLQAQTAWRFHRHAIPDSAALKPGADCRLDISVPHRGRGFVDIALCSVSEDVSFDYLRRVGSATSEEAVAKDGSNDRAPRLLLSNGDFRGWSKGIRFDAPTPKQEIADGWFAEGRGPQMRHVKLSLCSLSVPANGEAPGEPRFGIRVTTEEFEGPMRLVSPLAAGVLDESALSIGIALQASGKHRMAGLRSVMLLARGVGREAIARVLVRNHRVRGASELRFELDEADMIALRTACADMSNLVLCLEFERSSELCIERVEVTSAIDRVPAAPSVVASNEVVGFEDPAITGQLSLLHGVASWRNRAALGDGERAQIARAKRDSEQPVALSELDIAATRRPYVGYPSIDIVVPIYNALDAVRQCVRSVLSRTTVPYQLLLIDDASDADTAAWLAAVAARHPHITVLRNGENLGYTRSVNRGLSAALADHVCVLNSDCVVTQNWLEQLVDCAVHHPNAGMVGPLSNAASYQSIPRIRNDANEWSFNPLPASVSPDIMATRVRDASTTAWPRVRVINGFCQLISRKALDTVGLLDEQAFPRGFGEENDFCARVIAAGLDIHIADDTYVFHAKSKSFGHEQRKALSKEGSAALKLKHPDVDWKTVCGELEHHPEMVALRHRLNAMESV